MMVQETLVRVDGTQSEEFVVKVGVNQGSVQSPFLFIMVLIRSLVSGI